MSIFHIKGTALRKNSSALELVGGYGVHWIISFISFTTSYSKNICYCETYLYHDVSRFVLIYMLIKYTAIKIWVQIIILNLNGNLHTIWKKDIIVGWHVIKCK